MEKVILAKDVKREDGRKVYHLEGSNRYEWLEPIKARIFNRNRSDNKQWRECPDVPASQINDRPKLLTGHARREAELRGAEKDREWFVKREGQLNPVNNPEARKEDSSMAKDKATTKTKAEKPAKEKKAAKGGGGAGRPKWNGFTMGAMVRLCGSLGYSSAKTMAILDVLGLQHKLVNGDLKDGIAGKNIPELSGSQLKEFKGIAKAITEADEAKAVAAVGGKPKTEKKAKAEKPAKAEKKADKPKKKKAKPAPVEESADDDAEPSDEDREAAAE